MSNDTSEKFNADDLRRLEKIEKRIERRKPGKAWKAFIKEFAKATGIIRLMDFLERVMKSG